MSQPKSRVVKAGDAFNFTCLADFQLWNRFVKEEGFISKITNLERDDQGQWCRLQGCIALREDTSETR